MSPIPDILSWIKLPRHFAWPIVFVTGLVLFGPGAFKTGLGLDLFLDHYRIWVGVAFLFFLATGLRSPFLWVQSTLIERWNYHILKKERTILLANLTAEEKSILRGYLSNGTKSFNFDIQNGVISRLITTKFLYCASNRSLPNYPSSTVFPVNVQDWLWQELKKNQHYLD